MILPPACEYPDVTKVQIMLLFVPKVQDSHPGIHVKMFPELSTTPLNPFPKDVQEPFEYI
jgi:hypothetical protein